jgi:hypothetical protein
MCLGGSSGPESVKQHVGVCTGMVLNLVKLWSSQCNLSRPITVPVSHAMELPETSTPTVRYLQGGLESESLPTILCMP